jgi:hypothetical protein
MAVLNFNTLSRGDRGPTAGSASGILPDGAGGPRALPKHIWPMCDYTTTVGGVVGL